MADNLEVEGILSGFEKGKSGFKADGVTPYTNYKYNITKPDGTKFTCGGFLSPAPFIEKYVIVTYVKKVDGEKTYHNVKNIVEGVPKQNPAQQVATPPTGTSQPAAPAQPQETTEESQGQAAQEAVEETKAKINGEFNGSFFGMISNQTIKMILEKDKTKQANINLDEFKIIWNGVFDKLWKLNVDKITEKGG